MVYRVCISWSHSINLSWMPDLFRNTVVVYLQCVFLLVVVWGNDHPDHHDDLTWSGCEGQGDNRKTITQTHNHVYFS